MRMRGSLMVMLMSVLFLSGCDRSDPPADQPVPSTIETARSETLVTSSNCPNESAIAGDISKRFPPTLVDDVDGDGKDERVSMHLDPDGTPECLAFTVVEKEGVGTYSGVIVPTLGADPLVFGRIIGSGQVDAQPGIDIVILVGAGASTQFAAVYRWEESSLVPMEVEGGDHAFAFGGSAAHLDAVDCSDAGLIVSTTAVRTGNAYRVTRRFLEPRNGTFVEQRELLERRRLNEGELSSIPEFRSGPFATCPTS